MNSQAQKNKRKVFFFLTYKALAIDYFLFFAIDTMFLNEIKGLSFSMISLLITVFALSYLLFSIPAVRIVRKIGTANATRIGVTCMMISLALVCFDPWLIFISKVFYALGYVLKGVAEPKLLKDNLKMYGLSDNFTKYTALARVAYNIIDAVTCIAAGFLYTIWPYAPIILGTSILFVAVIMSIFIKNEKEVYKKTHHLPPHNVQMEKFEYIKLFKYKTTWLLLFFAALFFSLINCSVDINKMVFQDLGYTAIMISVTVGLVRVFRAVTTLVFERIYHKFGFKSIYVAVTLVSVGILAIGLGGIFLSGYTGLVVLGIGTAFLFASYDMYDLVRVDFVMNSHGLTKRQSLLVITNMGNYGGRMLVSLAVSGLLTVQSAAVTNLILLGCLLPFLIVICILLDRKKKINKY